MRLKHSNEPKIMCVLTSTPLDVSVKVCMIFTILSRPFSGHATEAHLVETKIWASEIAGHHYILLTLTSEPFEVRGPAPFVSAVCAGSWTSHHAVSHTGCTTSTADPWRPLMTSAARAGDHWILLRVQRDAGRGPYAETWVKIDTDRKTRRL